jgi:folate-binding protein YgfZ
MLKAISLSEYAAVRDGGAGLINLSARGRLLVSGSEASMFLNGLITNDVKALAVGDWMPAAFPNVQGRLLAAVRVIHRDDGFLIDTDEITREKVLKLLERFTLAGDFRVADVSEELFSLSVQGEKAEAAIRAVFDDTAVVARQKVGKATLSSNVEVTIIRATHTAEDGFDLFVKAEDLDELREALRSAGVQSVSADTFETLRIEAGIPQYGIDMDETTVVTETNLDDAVSFTKGCYIGQEIIVRIKHRGHVAKKLTGVVLENGAALEGGGKVYGVDAGEIGRITSTTFSPRLERTIALAYLKYDYLSPGTPVAISAGDGQIPSQVGDLPFIRGSWYTDRAL